MTSCDVIISDIFLGTFWLKKILASCDGRFLLNSLFTLPALPENLRGSFLWISLRTLHGRFKTVGMWVNFQWFIVSCIDTSSSRLVHCPDTLRYSPTSSSRQHTFQRESKLHQINVVTILLPPPFSLRGIRYRRYRKTLPSPPPPLPGEVLRHLCPVQPQILRKLHLAEKIVQKLCAGHSQPESLGAQKNCAKIVREPHFLRKNCAKDVRAQFSHNFGES